VTRRVRSLGVTALILAVAFAAQSARADGEDDGFARSGPYIGVGASRSLNLVEAYLDDDLFLDELEVSDAWGVNARAGYRVFSWFAAEVEYEWVDDLNVDLFGAEIGSIGVQSATANLRFIVPTWRFQPYLLVGGGVLWLDLKDRFGLLDVDDSAFAARIGLGIDMYLTKNFLVNLGVESILTNAEVSLATPFGTASQRGLGTVNLQVGFGYRF
jgi:outer membrane protein W